MVVVGREDENEETQILYEKGLKSPLEEKKEAIWVRKKGTETLIVKWGSAE